MKDGRIGRVLIFQKSALSMVIGFVTVMLPVRWREQEEAGTAPDRLSPSDGLTRITTPAYLGVGGSEIICGYSITNLMHNLIS